MQSKKSLIFIDTNIFLDFYRVHEEKYFDRLEKLVKVSDRLIITEQVEMEYKKNRAKIVLSLLRELDYKFQIPDICSELHLTKKIDDHKNEINKLIGKIKNNLKKILENPENHDETYKILTSLFNVRGALRLNYSDPNFPLIYERAQKRFNLGQPPRKNSDSSFGDAINWEWMLECCRENKSNLVLVTRDSDYFIDYNNKILPNLYLKDEFEKKTNGKKLVVLKSLSMGLKNIGQAISKEEIETEEKEIIENTASRLYGDATSGYSGYSGYSGAPNLGYNLYPPPPYQPPIQCPKCKNGFLQIIDKGLYGMAGLKTFKCAACGEVIKENELFKYI